MLDVVADLLDQSGDGGERAATDRLPGDDAEPRLDLVDPGRAFRGEVERDVRVLGQPPVDVGVVVGDLRREVRIVRHGERPLPMRLPITRPPQRRDEVVRDGNPCTTVKITGHLITRPARQPGLLRRRNLRQRQNTRPHLTRYRRRTPLDTRLSNAARPPSANRSIHL